jgi:hypothetical protein
MPEETTPPHTPPPTTTRDIANRIAGLEELTQDLQRRVRDLEQAQDEAAGEWPHARSIREENRVREEAAPGGAQIPPGAVAGERTEPRRDVLGSPHSDQ